MNTLNLFFGAVATADVQGVQSGLGAVLSGPDGSLYGSAFGEALSVCQDTIGHIFQREVAEERVPDLHFHGPFPPHYLERIGELFARSDGPTAGFFKSEADILANIREVMGDGRDHFLREADPVEDKLLGILGRREQLKRQHFERPNWTAHPEDGPFAEWFVREREETLRTMLEDPSSFGQGLIALMRNPNKHDHIANMAQGLAILLWEESELMGQIVTDVRSSIPRHLQRDRRYYGLFIKIVSEEEALLTRLDYIRSHKAER